MTAYDVNEKVNVGRREVLVAGLTAPIWLSEVAQSAVAEPGRSAPPDRQSRSLEMTVVYDNNPGRQGLISEWGFGCVIQGLEKTILFDTGGAGWALLANMRHLKVDIKSIDVVVLSHIHWDHTGGLPSVAIERSGIPVYVPTGFPTAFLEHARSVGTRPVEAERSAEICRGVRTTGTLGKGAIEEHGLCVKTAEGWVLITGCAHPGVDNMAAKAKEVTGGPMQLVLGGFHMIRHSKRMADAVIDRIEGLGVARVAPCHCTGDDARGLFKERLGDHCELATVGSSFRFESPTGTRES